MSEAARTAPLLRLAWRYRPFITAAVAVAALVWAFPISDDARNVAGSGPTTSAEPPGAAAGVGTPEALASPKCDAERQRVKAFTVWGPPCVKPWPVGSDNGGATSKGVTAEAIKVVLRLPPQGSMFLTGTPEATVKGYEDVQRVMERVYETWGRRVVVEPYQATGADEASERADAISIAAKDPFAVLAFPDAGDTFQSELANRGIVVVAFTVTPDVGAAQSPYRWGSSSDVWGSMKAVGEFVGKSLGSDRPARWAGDSSLQSKTRKYGVVMHEQLEKKVLLDELAQHGIEPEVVTYSTAGGTGGLFGDPARSAEQAPTIISRLKASGVTTVIMFTDLFMSGSLLSQATNQGLRPEWVSGDYQFSWVLGGSSISPYDKEQWSHAMGVEIGAPRPPKVDIEQLYEWYWGPQTTPINTQGLLLEMTLFNGFHLAGPNLTPETFKAGMFALPPSGGVSCQCVGSAQLSFGQHDLYPWDDYSSLDDYAISWYDPTATGRDYLLNAQSNGLPRYINQGQRYTTGNFPTEEPAMFDPAGTVVNFDEYPPSEKLPDYPCDGCPGGG